jgi:histidinol dehydrogenase
MTAPEDIGFAGTILQWDTLDPAARCAALRRPVLMRGEELSSTVARIIAQVRADGDAALRALTRRFDSCELERFEVGADEFAKAQDRVDADTRNAIDEAYSRIDAFHRATAPQPVRIETAAGVVCERVLRPIERVGLYVPAGGAPLPSTALMLGVPAQIARCPQVTVCTPAGRTVASTRPCCMPPRAAASRGYSSSAGRRPSRRWRSARNRCRSATSYSAPAMRG